MNFLRAALAVIFVGLSGCITGHVIKEAPHSLSEIKGAIAAVVGEPRGKSSNGREIESEYFSKKKNDSKFDPEKSKFRRYAKVTILGDRRPYDIQVQVFIEERIGGQYEEAGQDDDFADEVGAQIKAQLSKSRDGRILIDDFRAF